MKLSIPQQRVYDLLLSGKKAFCINGLDSYWFITPGKNVSMQIRALEKLGLLEMTYDFLGSPKTAKLKLSTQE